VLRGAGFGAVVNLLSLGQFGAGALQSGLKHQDFAPRTKALGAIRASAAPLNQITQEFAGLRVGPGAG
jgi:hypothetical protein